MNKIKILLDKNPEALLGDLIPELKRIVCSSVSDLTDYVHVDSRIGEFIAYGNKDLAIASALSKIAESFGDDKIGEYLAFDSAFSVVRIERSGRYYYDFLCDGYNTDFKRALDVDIWYERGWDLVRSDGAWGKREDLSNHV